jgi:DUF1680 family protein
MTGGFWAQRQQTNSDATLDHGRAWMDKLGWIGNFTAVAQRCGDAFDRQGREFSDSEVYKLIEAMCWDAGRVPNPTREAEIAELTAIVAGAQASDGYLNTAFGGPGQRPRYSDLASGHELYCTGHLLQAAVAGARTIGQDDLFALARRSAEHVCDTFDADGLWGICGHPCVEPALVEFARLTGEQRYLDQAALFVDRRGHRSLPQHQFGWVYFNDDVPVRDAHVLRGHAVRALYLAHGAVDVAVETGDDELLAAVVAQFDRTLARRTYLTGGMGSRYADESFGDDFVLPADRAYVETCAAVATVMLAWRLLLATGETRYGDVIERVLYNVIAAAIGDDGRSFFYANTLHQRTPAESVPVDRERLIVGGAARAPWYEVSCCLPNLGRLLASLGTYLVTATARGLQVHQYADAEVRTRLADGRPVGLRMRTSYPDDGAITVTVAQTPPGADAEPWSIAFRVPSWASGATLTDRDGQRSVAPGTATVRCRFDVGDEIRLDLPVRPRWTVPDARIDAVRGCVAVERGPIVLCAESVDQANTDLDDLTVHPGQPPADDPAGAVVPGRLRRPVDANWPYAEAATPVPVRLVPYHRWARRGPSTMRVWLPVS